MTGWSRVSRIRKGKDRWTVAEFIDARAELFGDRSTDVPKFPSLLGDYLHEPNEARRGPTSGRGPIPDA